MNVLEIKNICVESRGNKKKLLKNVSFVIPESAIHALIGANGSGKSSLAMAVMGISRFRISSGKIIFRGKDITDLPTDKRAQLGMTLAWQNPSYFEGISIREFIRAGNKDIKQEGLKRILALVGLSPAFLNRLVDRDLSGGERKRVELASVVAMRPKLIILDEPDSGLDIIIYRELYGILNNIKKQTNASVLLITHREELGIIADSASFIHQGKIVSTGRFRPVMRQYCQTLPNRVQSNIKLRSKRICPFRGATRKLC